jgi:hypothetical protein
MNEVLDTIVASADNWANRPSPAVSLFPIMVADALTIPVFFGVNEVEHTLENTVVEVVKTGVETTTTEDEARPISVLDSVLLAIFEPFIVPAAI